MKSYNLSGLALILIQKKEKNAVNSFEKKNKLS